MIGAQPEMRAGLRFPDLPGLKSRKADIANLTRRDEVAEPEEDFADRRREYLKACIDEEWGRKPYIYCTQC
jgi:hypothetical protein